GRAALGQPRRRLRGLLAHRVLAGPRRLRAHRGPAPLGQRRAHGAVLLQRRHGDQPGDGARRAARRPGPGRADDRGGRRARRPGPAVPRLQRRRARCRGVGHRDLHRHRGRHRRARAGRAALPRPAAGVPAGPGHRRRHRRRRRDRAVLHRRRRPHRAPAGRGAVPGPARAAVRPVLAHSDLRADRRGDVVGHAGQRRAPQRGRRGHGAAGERLRAAGLGHRPRAGGRPVLRRRPDARAGPGGPGGDGRGGVAQRAAPAADPAVEQLRHRAAVRAGQRGRGALGRDAGRRGHLADHDRHRRRADGRQADRRHGRHLGRAAHRAREGAGHAALGPADRRRRPGRHRVHRGAVRHRPRPGRRGPGQPGQDRHPRRVAARRRHRLDDLPRGRGAGRPVRPDRAAGASAAPVAAPGL
ncbi:MAG: Na+/H+ antiporter NhaA type, partial [uncultured Pseudonocardia sp.]